MNKLTIIGNLTRDPELRTTQGGDSVCNFTVAVNRRQTSQQKQNGQQPEADFFRVTVWRTLGELCAKYLSKGRKVAVVGPVSVHTYQGNDGQARASIEVTADDVEFLSSRQDADQGHGSNNPASPPQPTQAIDKQSGFEQVESDELPF